MDPCADCPICFETFGSAPEREEQKLECCGQSLCFHCKECLRRCPYCRALWHGEDDDDDNEGRNPWQRRSFPNPILTVWGTTLAFDAIRTVASVGVAGARGLATAAAAAAAEASPAVIAGSVAGSVALAGGVAIAVASQHSAQQAERLQNAVRSRNRTESTLAVSEGMNVHQAWRPAAAQLLEALQWHLSPQKQGMPHVYHGSPWRSRKCQQYQNQLRALLCGEEAPAESRNLRIWGDIVFCYILWLDFYPQTANWGTCESYGLPPMHLCWHNRWREDMRHVASDLARHLMSSEVQAQLSTQERSCAACLLAMLDHVLSWEVTTLDRGSSELISADWWKYPDFCGKLKERIAFAWAAALAPPEAELEIESVDSHIQAMATRTIPEGFERLW
eukprot:TRINITY_DN47822_c0_g1_i1.p1 TRINITY_DN47822_c0_g1~~TRINITY_DN47822_c0_g1_i1.p1  ORF type:complete len:407 (+),score=60.12 TRINITY_DN47822_c0_g1_i1:49-1221(+)